MLCVVGTGYTRLITVNARLQYAYTELSCTQVANYNFCNMHSSYPIFYGMWYIMYQSIHPINLG